MFAAVKHRSSQRRQAVTLCPHRAEPRQTTIKNSTGQEKNNNTWSKLVWVPNYLKIERGHVGSGEH